MEAIEIVEVVEISTENLVDPNQVGWIAYREGGIIIRVKVIRGKKRMFLSHVAGYGRGMKVKVIKYAEQERWNELSQVLLERFAAFAEALGNTAPAA